MTHLRRGAGRRRQTVLLLALLAACHAFGGENAWRPLAVFRCGNIDAVDAEDGSLAGFMGMIRNDGLFRPPLRGLVGPEIRNPTFYGLVYEGWLEGLFLAPGRPGPMKAAWIFPVDGRDDYAAHLAGQGLSEYEGMDGTTLLRELDPGGGVRDWYLEWLPGDVAVFGSDRDAVTAARRIYMESGASRGLLSGKGGRFLEPDIRVRLHPAALAAWQEEDPGRFWWRERVDKFAADLVNRWLPGSARRRLIDELAQRLAIWPVTIDHLDLSFWFEEGGAEWQFEGLGDFAPPPPRSQLDAMRRLPERLSLAWGLAVGPARFGRFGDFIAGLALGAAGGVVTTETRAVCATIWRALAEASPTQIATAWIPPPPGRPELGGSRMLVTEWGNAELLRGLWDAAVKASENPAVIQTLSQMGIRVALHSYIDAPGTFELRIEPDGRDGGEPYCHAAVAFASGGSWTALVSGRSPTDESALREVLEYRSELAASAVVGHAPGAPDVRSAFTRMDAPGASWMGIVEPVRFLQFALVEAADWQPRSPDQREPESTRLAREMLEYLPAGAWTAVGDAEPGIWRINGGMEWQSLARLSAALGITEAVNFE